MELIICCFYSVVCFVAGAVVSGGFQLSHRDILKHSDNQNEDQLALDIASMLQYDAGKQEENTID